MNILAAANTLSALTELIMNSMAQASALSSVLQKAHAEGRTALSPEEEAIRKAANALCHQKLVDEVASIQS